MQHSDLFIDFRKSLLSPYSTSKLFLKIPREIKLFIFTLTVIHFLINEFTNHTINNQTNEHVYNSFHFKSPLHLP
ncbi:hypothetical protein B4W74_05420 [Staphylococcus intermedius]|nr:hypothetical protein B5C04_05070 [Staphylococcus intermedius]PCF81103.1 hypothetical protein B4W74_05420 [Staphylococcus intermedius]PCF82385.1 hypothetical protein B4W70_05065 [Staphylococcus intermedius]